MPKILLFEDDLFLRGMYVAKYVLEGFAVAAYEHPTKDPISIVLKEKPDIISMDILMPISNGFEATEKIKSDARTKNIPLFFLTNLGLQTDIDRGLGLGAFKYVIKANHTPDEVVAIIRQQLGLPAREKSVEVSREVLNRFISNPTHEPLHADPQTFATTTTAKPSPTPASQPQRIQLSRGMFVTLVLFAVVGAIAVIGWLFR